MMDMDLSRDRDACPGFERDSKRDPGIQKLWVARGVLGVGQ